MTAPAAGPARKVPVHYLKTNDTSWSPRRVIFFDTETRYDEDARPQVHHMRLWAARFDQRTYSRGQVPHTERARGHTAAELAAALGDWATGSEACWAFAHNLSFDLIAARLLPELEAQGWQVSREATGSPWPWMTLGRGKSVLTFADSFSWLPASLATIGAELGITKLPLPGPDDPDADMFARCESDTEILASAMLGILDWWTDNLLGRWQHTGASTALAMARHKMPKRSILVNADTEQVTWDRKAIYGGRREVFSHGPQSGGPFAEYDFTQAYLTTLAECPVPVKRLARFPALAADHGWIDCPWFGVIAEVEVETDLPRWPARVGGRVHYPVGRFRTVLASPEIARARDLGCLRAVGPGWVYRLGTPLAAWARWALAVQRGELGPVHPAVARFLKHAGRAVVGKFAARGWHHERLTDAEHPAWSSLPAWNVAARARETITQLGVRRFATREVPLSDNAFPAVLAWVESHVRLRLSAVIDAAPDGAVICCDTDGLTARPGELPDSAYAPAVTGPLIMRPKHVYRRIDVLGPQHIKRDGRAKLAGIPGAAEQTARGEYTALLWPKLAWQLGNGANGGYVRPPQSYRLLPCYVSGFVLDTGRVRPVVARTGPAGAAELAPWTGTPYPGAGDQLGPVQAPWMAPLCPGRAPP
jgi:hypothetical protein